MNPDKKEVLVSGLFLFAVLFVGCMFILSNLKNHKQEITFFNYLVETDKTIIENQEGFVSAERSQLSWLDELETRTRELYNRVYVIEQTPEPKPETPILAWCYGVYNDSGFNAKCKP